MLARGIVYTVILRNETVVRQVIEVSIRNAFSRILRRIVLLAHQILRSFIVVLRQVVVLHVIKRGLFADEVLIV